MAIEPENRPPEAEIRGLGSLKKLIIIVVSVVIIVGLGLGVYFTFISRQNSDTANGGVNQSAAASNKSINQGAAAAPVDVGQTLNDDDRDGLSNDEEKSLGTDSGKADTDADGLSDYEEAKVYKTDPLKADTDGDGYQDGAEVENGFNPNGAGNLLNINVEINKTNTNQ
ncbi:MAG: hypothetical protein WC528_04505 [Patescibacteria group bacterium]